MTPISAGDELATLLRCGRARCADNGVYLRWSPDGGELRELGYRAACARIDRLGTQFATWGLRPGARVLIASADDQALATIFIACLEYGLTAMVVDDQAKPAEIAAIMAIQGPDAVMVDQGLLASWPLAQIVNCMAIGSSPRPSLTARLLRRAAPAPPSQRTYPESVDALVPSTPPSGLDPALDAYVLFTSGSTGRPKGVCIQRHALAAHARTLIARWGYDCDCRILNILPLHHADGLIQALVCAWASGAMCVRSGRFRISAIVSLLIDPIYSQRITHLVAVPTMLALLLRLARAETGAFRDPAFRFVISAAGQLDDQLWREFERHFAVRVCNLYGLTETVTGGCFAGPDDASHVIGSVGVAVDCAVRVVDDGGAVVAAGVVGELQLRGAQVMRGYLNDAAATAATLAAGWLRSGDLATIDAGGVVRIVGRKKSVVVCGGLNIQPEEVAALLRTLPGVADAVAFGIPDPTFTEILVACVAATEPGVRLDVDGLARGCLAQLPSFKVPKVIVQLPALPYGPAGKVMVPRAHELFAVARVSTTSSPDRSSQERSSTARRNRIYAVAAEAFHQLAEQLTAEDAPGRTPGWDSFAHLTFITGLEAAFVIRLMPADIIAIRSLGDAERVIGKALGD